MERKGFSGSRIDHCCSSPNVGVHFIVSRQSLPQAGSMKISATSLEPVLAIGCQCCPAACGVQCNVVPTLQLD